MQLIPQKNAIQLYLDTGYQHFFNIKYDLDKYYKNTPYVNLGLRFNAKYAYLWTNFMLDRNNSPYPIFDISLGLNLSNFIASGRFLYPTGNSGNYGAGGRLYWAPFSDIHD
jgi:hypothetical protein